jgi:hypothetical protein
MTLSLLFAVFAIICLPGIQGTESHYGVDDWDSGTFANFCTTHTGVEVTEEQIKDSSISPMLFFDGGVDAGTCDKLGLNQTHCRALTTAIDDLDAKITQTTTDFLEWRTSNKRLCDMWVLPVMAGAPRFFAMWTRYFTDSQDPGHYFTHSDSSFERANDHWDEMGEAQFWICVLFDPYIPHFQIAKHFDVADSNFFKDYCDSVFYLWSLFMSIAFPLLLFTEVCKNGFLKGVHVYVAMLMAEFVVYIASLFGHFIGVHAKLAQLFGIWSLLCFWDGILWGGDTLKSLYIPGQQPEGQLQDAAESAEGEEGVEKKETLDFLNYFLEAVIKLYALIQSVFILFFHSPKDVRISNDPVSIFALPFGIIFALYVWLKETDKSWGWSSDTACGYSSDRSSATPDTFRDDGIRVFQTIEEGNVLVMLYLVLPFFALKHALRILGDPKEQRSLHWQLNLVGKVAWFIASVAFFCASQTEVDRQWVAIVSKDDGTSYGKLSLVTASIESSPFMLALLLGTGFSGWMFGVFVLYFARSLLEFDGPRQKAAAATSATDATGDAGATDATTDATGGTYRDHVMALVCGTLALVLITHSGVLKLVVS